MAALYDILGTEESVERIGPTRVRDIHIITAVAKPSGVVYWFSREQAGMAPADVALTAHDLAVAMNTLADKPGVVGIRWEQNTSAYDLFTTTVVVTVESASGNSSADVRLAYGDAQGPAGYKKVAAQRAALDALEAL